MRRRRSARGVSARLDEAGREARRIARWRARLAPRLPQIDPHDLDLIIAALLRTPKQRMRKMFLRRREDGGYEF